jgi:putative ABC transport system permease protein
MNLTELIRTAFEALKTNKSRTVLTMLGVVIGVASVILLVSIGNGLQTYITKQLESLGANTVMVVPGNVNIGSEKGGNSGGGFPGAGVSSSKFTFSHLNELKKEALTIKLIMAYTENNGTVKYRGIARIVQIAGVGPEYPIARNTQISQGNFFNLSQYSSAKKVVVLGKTVADKLFGEKTSVGEKVTIADQPYLVVGVMEKKGSFGQIDMDNQVFIPTTTAMRVFDMQYIQTFWVQSQNANTVEQTKQEIKRILLKSLKEDDFSIVDTKSILDVISQIIGVLTIALGGIAAISLVVGGVGIMNIMLVSVTERTREVGLRKAMGAKPKIILNQFLIEASVLSIGGGLIGIGLGILLSALINHFFATTITLWSIILAFLVSASIGIGFGVYPAYKAAKLNPIEALRYE